MSGVVVIDRGANAMLARARKLASSRRAVRVGILDDAPKEVKPGQKPPKMTLAQVAALHEFGAPDAHIPMRSFIRSTVDERQGEILDLQVKLGAQVIAGKIDPDVALERLGLKVVGWVQAKIASNVPPKLADETVARKKSSVALVNTGQMKSAVTSRVVDA